MMKLVHTGPRRGNFDILAATRSAQAAMMTLQLGADTGDVQNEHPRSEQWLFVISGSGWATVGRRRVALRTNDLLLINKGEPHQIKNTGRRRLVTLSFYAPPAYTPDGEPR